MSKNKVTPLNLDREDENNVSENLVCLNGEIIFCIPKIKQEKQFSFFKNKQLIIKYVLSPNDRKK